MLLLMAFNAPEGGGHWQGWQWVLASFFDYFWLVYFINTADRGFSWAPRKRR
jgi:hypothetical protein